MPTERQPYVAATVRMYSDVVFSSISASQLKTLIKKFMLVKWFSINHCCFGFGSWIHVNQPLHSITTASMVEFRFTHFSSPMKFSSTKNV